MKLTKYIVAVALASMFVMTSCTNSENGKSEEASFETSKELTSSLEISTEESKEESTDESADSSTDTEEPEQYGQYISGEALQEKSVLLSPSNITDMKPYELKGTASIATRIHVGEGCNLTSVSVLCPSYGNNKGIMFFEIFSWNTDYDTTISQDPIYTYKVKEYTENERLTVDLPEDITFGEGTYLYRFYKGGSGGIGLYMADYDFSAMQDEPVRAEMCYEKGGIEYAGVHHGYVTYKTDVPVEIPAVDPQNVTRPTKEKAHVIILSGQSNAAGATLTSYLSTTVPKKDLTKYKKGYENVLINYGVDPDKEVYNRSYDFVPVTLGQGCTEEKFGPEVGLAEYLSEAYPDEIFYIIKAPQSAAQLHSHFVYDLGGVYTRMITHVQESLSQLESKGLDPEIIAVCWMQGESDAMELGFAREYGVNTVTFIERLNTVLGKYVVPGGFAYIEAGISEYSGWKYSGIINQFKKDFAVSRPNHYYIDTQGAGMTCEFENNDPLHYDSASMIKLGNLFGAAVETVIEKGKAVQN